MPAMALVVCCRRITGTTIHSAVFFRLHVDHVSTLHFGGVLGPVRGHCCNTGKGATIPRTGVIGSLGPSSFLSATYSRDGGRQFSGRVPAG